MSVAAAGASTGSLSFEFASAEGEAGTVSKGLCALSPDGTLVASVAKTHLRVFELATMRVISSHSVDKDATCLEWSPNSKLLFTASTVSRAVQVNSASAEDSKWSATFSEGPAGLMHACWSPDSRCILTVSDFGLMSSVYNVMDGVTTILEPPKVPDVRPPHSMSTLSFSPDGALLALLSRKDGKDYIALYEVSSWTQLRRFPIDTTDAQSISWSPDNTLIAVCDDPVSYKLSMYFVDGRCALSYKAYEHALGITTSVWSTVRAASGDTSAPVPMLAVGSYDNLVRVINGFTLSSSVEMACAPVVDGSCTLLYVEVEESDGDADVSMAVPLKETSNMRPKAAVGTRVKPTVRAFVKGANTSLASAASATTSKTAVDRCSRIDIVMDKFPLVTVPTVSSVKEPSLPRIGPIDIQWSFDSHFLAVRMAQFPSAVFIFESHESAPLSVVHVSSPVTSISWSPVLHRLAIACGASKMFVWEQTGTSAFPLAAGLGLKSVSWSLDGASILLTSKSHFRVGYTFTGKE